MSSRSIYQLTVMLRGFRPPIWRRVRIAWNASVEITKPAERLAEWKALTSYAH